MKTEKKVTASVETLNVSIKKTDEKYTVSGNNISWDYKRGVIELTIDALDYLFYQYSKHGLNMSAVQCQNSLGFDALQWQSVKRTFDLVKDSDVFSPYTLSQYSGKDQCDMIASKIAEKYEAHNLRNIIAYEDNKQTKKAYEKAVKESAKSDYKRQQFENGLLEYITESKLAPLVQKSSDVKVGNAIVHVCDLHVGADIEAERNLPAYNVPILKKKLASVAKDANSRKAKNVTLVINGDLIETFTGLNHINSWKNIDKKYGYGVNATIQAIEVLTKFISSVNNVSEVILTSGNHDRVTTDNKEDVTGEVVQWVHFVLNARFKNKIKIVWSKDVASREIDGMGFVFTHGHLALSKKNPELLVNQYGFVGKFNIVLMAHLHTRKVLADSMMYRVIHAPSMFTGNDYSKGLGFTSLSGYLFITVSNKLPIVIDVPIT
jgi:metallophosphoesterase superfamily enzyme